MTRVAIYARYSSDNQRAASIDDQIRLCREYAEKQGWAVARTYHDEAISAASLIRPEIQALLEDARDRKFDVVLTEALDRISRDQEDTAGVYKRLAFADVKFITVSEGEITELHVGLKGTMNALALKDLADKTRRGLRGRVELGKSGGGRSYGYEVVKRIDDAGELVRGDRRILDSEANVVRRIFKEYANGASPRSIAAGLNSDGVPGPSGKPWGASTIHGSRQRGTGILNNEMYVGKLVWNKLRYIKDPDTGKRVSRMNPESDWIIKKVGDLRIVDQTLWDRVKDRQKAVNGKYTYQGENHFRDRRRPRYLLSGLLVCDACGGSYVVCGDRYLNCSNYRYRGTCTNKLSIRRTELEDRVLSGLKRHLCEPSAFEAFAKAYTAEINRSRIDRNTTLEAQQSELRRIETKLSNLVDVLAVRGTSAAALVDEIENLEARKTELAAIVAESGDRLPTLCPSMSDIYAARLRQLYETLSADDARPAAIEVLRNLISAVHLVPENGKLAVEIEGDLVGLLALASVMDRPAAGAAGQVPQDQSRFELVAGARNHRQQQGLFRAVA